MIFVPAQCLSVLANAARLMENEMSHLVAEDASGQNPLDIAEREGHSGCVDVLSMRGVQRKAKVCLVRRKPGWRSKGALLPTSIAKMH